MIVTKAVLEAVFTGKPQRKGGKRFEGLEQRDAEWVAMYRDGKSMMDIATQYGFTREYIRLRLAAHGLTARNYGFARKRELGLYVTPTKFAAQQEKVDANKRRKWGISIAEYRAMIKKYGSRKKSPFEVYDRFRNNVRRQRLPFDLPFPEWLRLWHESGKYSERGQGSGYWMARKDPSLPYRADNLYIASGREVAHNVQVRLKAKREAA